MVECSTKFGKMVGVIGSGRGVHEKGRGSKYGENGMVYSKVIGWKTVEEALKKGRLCKIFGKKW